MKHELRKFRVLYRQFLFRLMDLDVLASSARGDSTELIGQFASLLIFGSVLVSLGAVTVGQAIRRLGAITSAWSAELLLISLTMLVVGVFTLLSWDAILPDRRDLLVLSAVPIRPGTLLTAKMAAAACALGLTVVAWNCLAGFAWPLVLAPPGSSLMGSLRFIAAFWATMLAAGAFLYAAILGLQAIVVLLPRRWSLRASPVVQVGVFIALLSAVCFQPSLTTTSATAMPGWLPTYWFVGLLNELSGAHGDQVMSSLAQRAIWGLAGALAVAGGAVLFLWPGVLRKIVEEPDVAPGSRGGVWLPRFGNSPQTAVAHFVIRTLMRSRRHAATYAFYLGGGFAVTAVYMEGGRSWMRLTWPEMMRLVDIPWFVATVLMLAAACMGARAVFALPLDLRANWIFRITAVRGGIAILSAVRRALLAISVFPVVLVSAAILLWFWPWAPAAQHLLVLTLLGLSLTNALLWGYRKIPFTCSYLPGKSKVHLVFWFGVIPLVIAIHQTAKLERLAMADAASYWAMAAGLGALALLIRWLTNNTASEGEVEVEFEQSAADEMVVLGLHGTSSR